MKQWLAERLQVLLPRLAALGKDQEGEIKQLCEEEIASWRSRPTMKSLRSLNTPMIDARNAIKEQLAVTQDNSWLNPRSGEREHLARKYLNFSEAEWAMHALTEEGRQQRLEGVECGFAVQQRDALQCLVTGSAVQHRSLCATASVFLGVWSPLLAKKGVLQKTTVPGVGDLWPW
jgi:hypothetical protein